MLGKLQIDRLAVVVFVISACSAARAEQAENPDLVTGERLAALLEAGLDTVSSHQSLINDPTLASKGLTGIKIVDEAMARFDRNTGRLSLDPDASERDKRLTKAQLDAMASVVDDFAAVIDIPGVGFKGFIPSLFGRLSNERFAERVGDEARMKMTAPQNLVRNRRSLPDPWERRVMEDRFMASDWIPGRPYYETVDVDGRSAFRIMVPSYYKTSCLSCHGQPRGELDITGYPKEGGAEGGLGGAISITLFEQ